MRAIERFERCIFSVILGRVTWEGCAILASLSDEFHGSVTCISKKVLFSIIPANATAVAGYFRQKYQLFSLGLSTVVSAV